MCIRLAKQGPPAYVSGPLIARRLHQSNATLDISEIVRGARLIEKLHHTKVDWGALHRWFAHSCMRARRLSTALGHFGRAAVRGQGRAVASDLSVILQRIVSGRTPKSSDYGPDEAWIAIATEWLQELSHSAHGRTEDPRVLSEKSPAPEAT